MAESKENRRFLLAKASLNWFLSNSEFPGALGPSPELGKDEHDNQWLLTTLIAVSQLLFLAKLLIKIVLRFGRYLRHPKASEKLVKKRRKTIQWIVSTLR